MSKNKFAIHTFSSQFIICIWKLFSLDSLFTDKQPVENIIPQKSSYWKTVRIVYV